MTDSADLRAAWIALASTRFLSGTDLDGELPGKLHAFASGVADRADLPPFIRESAIALRDCAGLLLDPKASPDSDFKEELAAFLGAYAEILDGNSGPKLRERLDRLNLFLQLYNQQLAPVRTAPAGKKMLGAYLVELGFVTKEQVDNAFAAQKAGTFPGKRLGDILEEWGVLTRAQLDAAIEQQMLDNMG